MSQPSHEHLLIACGSGTSRLVFREKKRNEVIGSLVITVPVLAGLNSERCPGVELEKAVGPRDGERCSRPSSGAHGGGSTAALHSPRDRAAARDRAGSPAREAVSAIQAASDARVQVRAPLPFSPRPWHGGSPAPRPPRCPLAGCRWNPTTARPACGQPRPRPRSHAQHIIPTSQPHLIATYQSAALRSVSLTDRVRANRIQTLFSCVKDKL